MKIKHLKRIVFKILEKLFMVMIICVFLFGGCALVLGTLLKFIGYLLWLDKTAAMDEGIDLYNEIKRIF